jgi:hypothetical protein
MLPKSLFQNEGIHPLVLPYFRGHFGNSEMASELFAGRIAALLLMVFALTLGLPWESARAQVPDTQIKAAFLLNFAKYAQWPETSLAPSDAPLKLCILGRDPFGEALRPVPIGGRPLSVERGVADDALKSCHIAYIAESEDRRLPRILALLRGKPVLTVSDIDGFAENGGMIELVLADGRVRFDINLAAANASQLRLSSQLLKLARSVRDANGRAP